MLTLNKSKNSGYFANFKQVKKISSYFADFEQVKKISSYFADFEQVKKNFATKLNNLSQPARFCGPTHETWGF